MHHAVDAAVEKEATGFGSSGQPPQASEAVGSSSDKIPDSKAAAARTHQEEFIQGILDAVLSRSDELYRFPMYRTIEALGISNLGKFADFLIHLQAFRSATDEGEATVGGLVESLTISPEHGVR